MKIGDILIVPPVVQADIFGIINRVVEKHPEASGSRSVLHDQLLAYYEEHGTLPPDDQLEIERIS